MKTLVRSFGLSMLLVAAPLLGATRTAPVSAAAEASVVKIGLICAAAVVGMVVVEVLADMSGNVVKLGALALGANFGHSWYTTGKLDAGMKRCRRVTTKGKDLLRDVGLIN